MKHLMARALETVLVDNGIRAEGDRRSWLLSSSPFWHRMPYGGCS